jgi:hypothetical protein
MLCDGTTPDWPSGLVCRLRHEIQMEFWNVGVILSTVSVMCVIITTGPTSTYTGFLSDLGLASMPLIPCNDNYE